MIVRAIAAGMLFAGAGAVAGEPMVRARVDSTAYVVGDPVTVHVEFTHDEGVSFVPLFGDTLGLFAVLAPPRLDQSQPTRTTGSFVVSYYDSGNVAIPPASFSFRASGDSLLRTVTTQALPVRFSLVQVDTLQPIRDLKPPMRIPMSAAEIALYVGITAAVIGLLYLLYRLWKKWKQRTAPVSSGPEVRRPAHVIALEDLGRLKDRRLWQQGLAKEYYVGISEIIRQYFENRFGVNALEETTPEIIDRLTREPVSHETLELIRGLLGQADLVKFARFIPDVPEFENSMAAAYQIVEETRVKPAEPVADRAEMEGEHVGA